MLLDYLPATLRQQLIDLAPHILYTHTWRKRDGRSDQHNDIRSSAKTPKKLLGIKLPCKCGRSHLMLVKNTTHYHLRTVTRVTRNCGPIVSKADLAAFFDSLRPELTQPHHLEGGQVIRVEHETFRWTCTYPEGLDFTEYDLTHPPKKQPALNVPRLLKARPERMSSPKLEGMTPSEIQCLTLLERKYDVHYDAHDLYLIIKAGGTPDFYVIRLSDGVVVEGAECKTNLDRLSAITQRLICKAWRDSHWPIRIYEFHKEYLH